MPNDHLGRLAPVLQRHRLRYRYLDVHEGSFPVPDGVLEAAEGYVSLGGPMSANEDHRYLRQEVAILAQAIERGKPVLGICLGAQLLAKALGARVYRNPVREIGWHPIFPAAGAAHDRLFWDCQRQPVFHWHSETFDLPAGAAWLAFSESCRHQAFRYGDRTWGLQFHLEVDQATAEEWYREDAAGEVARETDGPITDEPEGVETFAEQVFSRWASLVSIVDNLPYSSE